MKSLLKVCPLENNENTDKNNYEDICFSSSLEGSHSDVSLQPEVHLNVNVKECCENQLCKFNSTTCDPSDSSSVDINEQVSKEIALSQKPLDSFGLGKSSTDTSAICNLLENQQLQVDQLSLIALP